MNKRNDQKQLLADVLAEESGDGFSEALLGETLWRARRRRHWRQTRRAGGVLAVILVAALTIWRNLPDRTRSPVVVQRSPASTAYQLIVSQPLQSSQIIHSQPFAPDQFSAPFSAVTFVYSRPGGFRAVDDEELLSLAAPQTAALVRRGPHEAELILVSANTGQTEGQN